MSDAIPTGTRATTTPRTAVLLLSVLAVGGLFTWWAIRRADHALREEVLGGAQLVAQAISVDSCETFRDLKAGRSSPGCLRLRDQLARVQRSHDKCRFIILFGSEVSDKTPLLSVGDAPLDSPAASELGPSCDNVSDGFRHVREVGERSAEGPFYDRMGSWVSGVVPITTPHADEPTAMLCMGIDASGWKRTLARAALPPALSTLAIVAILLGGSFLRRRAKIRDAEPRWMRPIEPVLAAALGVLLTLCAAWTAHESESRARREAFRQLADSKTARIANVFQNLCNVELEGLARFCQGTEDIEQDSFQRYAEHLTKNHAVQAWEWIPVVAGADKTGFEERTRRAGLQDFEIWERDGQNNRVAANGREVYYPVVRLLPEAGNQRARGFDLGSEPIRRAALEEAMRTGLPTATDPITLVQETSQQKGLLIYRPVFSIGEPKRLRGFALAVLRMGTLLQDAGPDESAHLGLALSEKDLDSRPLASSCNAEHNVPPGLSAVRPVLALGRAFLVTAHAGPEFLRPHPTQAGMTILLAGLLLTAVLSLVVQATLRRRQELEQLVVARTAGLLASKERFDQLAEQSRTINWEVDLNGLYTYVSHVTEPVLGYRPDEMVGRMHFYDMHPESGREALKAAAFEVFKRKERFENLENAMLTKDGRIVWVSTNGIPLLDADGNLRGYRGSDSDVTKRRRAEEALRESERSYRNQFANNSAVMLLVDPADGAIVDANPAATRFYGYSRGQLLALRITDINVLATSEVRQAMASVPPGKGKRFEFQHRLADGSIRDVEVSSSSVRFGSRLLLHSIIYDITVRKRAEQSLQESETLQRQLLANLPTGVLIVDPSTRVIEMANDCVATLFGEPADRLVGQRCHSLLCPSAEGFCPVCDLNQVVDNSDQELLRADGSRIPVLKTVKRIRLNGHDKLLECFVDVSERKRMEHAQRDQRDLLTSVIEGTNVGTWRWNVQTGEALFNERWARMAGRTTEELAPSNIETWRGLTHPDDSAESESLLQKHFSGTLEYYDFECRVRHKNGSWIWGHDRGKVTEWTSDGKPLVMTGTRSDITARKRAEDALRQTTDRLSLAVRAGGVGIWDYDVVNNKLIWDDQMFRLYGITRDQFGGAYEAWQAGVHPDDRQRGDEEIQLALQGVRDFNTSFRVLWPDGSVHYIRALALVQRDASGEPTQMIGTNWDITAQKQSEAALRESEENFRTCFTSIGDMMAVVAPGGQLLYGNTAFMHKLRYSPQEVLGLHVLDVHPADVRDEAAEIFAAMLRGDRTSCPLPWITKSGELIPVETRIWPGKWNGKDCIYGIGKDMTEQQAALQMFEKVFEANPAPMALSRLPDRTFAKVNRAFSAVTGYDRDEVVGKTGADLGLFADPDEARYIAEELARQGTVRGMAITVRIKDGRLLQGLLFGEVVKNQGDQYFLTAMIDISLQKRIERELRETQQHLEERVQERTIELQTLNTALRDENARRREIEASLQEQQHNLRRLASQLTLAEEAQRHELAVQLHDTIGQELAMARLRLEHAKGNSNNERERHFEVAGELLDAAIGHVHHLTHGLGASVLYQLGLPAALRSIGNQVSEQHSLEFTFHQVGDYRRSNKEMEVHAFRMARELVFNAVKHARASRLDVTLSINVDAITVCVEDNGSGFVPEAGLKKNSDIGSGFGLFSIRERLAILGGRLTLLSSPGQGTVASIIIPLPNSPLAATDNGEHS